jgi:enoyl-CoA hydratase/carnithine racemase
MEFYKETNTTDFHDQTFAFLLVEEVDHVLTIILNREKKRNALHPQMVNEITYAFQYAHSNKDIWMIVIGAKGNVFCAGADLKAFVGLVEPNDSTIPQPKGEILIGELFNKVHKPIIAKITGDVYAGGFFFLSGATIAIAQDNIKFGLPEVKRGLYPFQVMASLMQVMPARKVVDWCIRGYTLPVEEAEKYGLVTQVVKAKEMDKTIHNIIKELKGNSPTAIRNGLVAYDYIQPKGEVHKYLYKILIETMQSKDGKEGLKAFREKRSPIWTGE